MDGRRHRGDRSAELDLGLEPARRCRIASIRSLRCPPDGAVHLLIRQMLRPQGETGSRQRLAHTAGAAGRCDRAAHPHELDLSPAERRSPADPDRQWHRASPACVRLLKSRIAAGRRRNWLLFGERNAASGSLLRQDLDAMGNAKDGSNTLDSRVFPRHGRASLRAAPSSRNVPIGSANGSTQGAAIYVCGSLHGMAPAVDAALKTDPGRRAPSRASRAGRYCRDVY